MGPLNFMENGENLDPIYLCVLVLSIRIRELIVWYVISWNVEVNLMVLFGALGCNGMQFPWREYLGEQSP